MKIGIISDTHDHTDNIAKALKVFISKGVLSIIHLGDYCSGPAVRAFQGAKLIGISGNNDGDLLRITKNFQDIGADFRGEFCELKFDILSIACYHGTVPEMTEALILSKKYDVVLSGHTHQASAKIIDGILAVNPGSAHGLESVPTVAVLDTLTKDVEIVEL